MHNRPTPIRRWLILPLVLAAAPIARAGDNPALAAEQAIEDLYAKGKLFARKEYKAVRKAFADRFEAKYQDVIKRAYGADYANLTSWLNDNPDVREEFYTAVSEKYDNIPAALGLFRAIYKKYPEKIKTYFNLAIAVAVTWDVERTGVYDYRHHQLRTRSKLPGRQLAALDNFRYFLDNEKVMQGRAAFLPWEFLVHVVNHKTPRAERQWSLKNYLNRRVMIGRCYKDVAYDYDMLRKNAPHLAGKDYTLSNLRRYGGVCAMQADFAARVGKSLGVPAEYVGGQANSGGLHAWVMWVELKRVTKSQILFSLESHGRYQIDQYYTGTLRDPQTGLTILDRDMELRLSLAGLDLVGKRQADLAMRAYALLLDNKKLVEKDRLAFLNKCIKLCPYKEEPWLALARMAREGRLTSKQVTAKTLNKLLTTFRRFPDFTWKVFDDLLSVYQSQDYRTKVYERVVSQFELAGRPDLACAARLKLADYFARDKKFKQAANGLAFTIKKFPAEGRYVPRMMKRLQEVCKEYKDGTTLLKVFYLEILGRIPAKRGSEPSQYCMDMYRQAITFFKENKEDKIAAALERELAKIRKSGKR
jgi:hypothetical protein